MNVEVNIDIRKKNRSVTSMLFIFHLQLSELETNNAQLAWQLCLNEGNYVYADNCHSKNCNVRFWFIQNNY